MVKNLPEIQGTQETWAQTLGQENPLEGMAAPCRILVENPTDRGTWQTTVHRVAKSRTWLK